MPFAFVIEGNNYRDNNEKECDGKFLFMAVAIYGIRLKSHKKNQ